MRRNGSCALLLLMLLGSCARGEAGREALLVERDSPAVGKDGRLVEDVGLETLGGVFTPLLRAGCATPCRDAELFSTAQDGQTKIQIRLFRGKGKLVSETHPLGDCHVVDIPPAPRGVPQIEVTVEAAGKGIRLYAFDKAAERPVPVRCDAGAARRVIVKAQFRKEDLWRTTKTQPTPWARRRPGSN